jgi:hypothetical protein
LPGNETWHIGTKEVQYSVRDAHARASERRLYHFLCSGDTGNTLVTRGATAEPQDRDATITDLARGIDPSSCISTASRQHTPPRNIPLICLVQHPHSGPYLVVREINGAAARTEGFAQQYGMQLSEEKGRPRFKIGALLGLKLGLKLGLAPHAQRSESGWGRCAEAELLEVVNGVQTG